jgi:hypothetical protein
VEDEALFLISDYVEPKQGREPGPCPVVLDSYLALVTVAANSPNSPGLLLFSPAVGATTPTGERKRGLTTVNRAVKRKKSFLDDALEALDEEEEVAQEFVKDAITGELQEATLTYIIAAITAGLEGIVKKTRTRSNPTLPYPTLPYPTLPYPILPYPTLSYPTLPYPILSYPTVYLRQAWSKFG